MYLFQKKLYKNTNLDVKTNQTYSQCMHFLLFLKVGFSSVYNTCVGGKKWCSTYYLVQFIL